MLRIGLTGNIASGKSTVSRRFAELGARVVDADILAREAVAPGTPALAAITNRFGTAVLNADGSLNRKTLRELVFNNPDALADLNRIVHPEVGRLRAERASEALHDRVQVFIDEIPLLFEAGLADQFDAIVFVDAPEHERLRRLMQDRGLPSDVAQAMMSAQGEVAPKRARATWVIDNDGSRDALLERTDSVWQDILARVGP
jgi:dephospho-CoA kinase